MPTVALPLSGLPIPLSSIAAVARGSCQVTLADQARERIEAARAVVEQRLLHDEVVYGVNTGFGKLSDVRIPAAELKALQLNLVRSHACGLGRPLSEAEVRAMMLLRANVLAKGCSGCRVEVIETLIAMIGHGVRPVIPEKGSVGASGDLAPLAHLALVIVGEGEAFYCSRRMPGGEAMRAAGIAPIELSAKEGLALLNGTQAMGAVGGLALERALRVVELADLAGAMSLDALLGTAAAFDEQIHMVRPHAGQLAAARHLRNLNAASEITQSHRNGDSRVQDAYCLRCMPQVHGAARDTLAHAARTVEIESGSATDNPLVFPETGDILSGGNFHGAPLAAVFDFAAISLATLAAIAERRIDRLVNPDINEGLPPFLSQHPGTSSGFMIAHVCAAALLNECKVLSHPASADSVPTSGGKEDHVSMGMTAALKLRQSVENLENILAIELLAAAEGIRYRAPLRSSARIEAARRILGEVAAPLIADRPLHLDIEAVADAIRAGRFDEFRSDS